MPLSLPIRDDEDTPTLSYSSLRLYGACPKAWWHRYINKTPRMITGRMHLGTALDRAIRNLHDQVIEGRTVDADAAKQLGFSEWEAESDIDMTDVAELEIDKAIDDCVTAYADKVLPTIHPLKTQVRAEKPIIVEGEKVTLLGYIDLIEETDHGTVVTDIKTTTTGRSSSMYTDDSLKTDVQLRMYQAMYGDVVGRGWRVADLGLKRGVKIRNIHVYEEPGEINRINELTMFAVQEQASLVNHSCGNWDFPPTAIGTWKCSDKYCDYYTACEFGHGLNTRGGRIERTET
jgi:hypothetical protein